MGQRSLKETYGIEQFAVEYALIIREGVKLSADVPVGSRVITNEKGAKIYASIFHVYVVLCKWLNAMWHVIFAWGDSSVVERWIPDPTVGGSTPSLLRFLFAQENIFILLLPHRVEHCSVLIYVYVELSNIYDLYQLDGRITSAPRP